MRKSGQYSGDNRWGIPDGNNRRESRWNPRWECQRNERRAFTRRPKCAWDPLKIDLISKWRLCSRCGPTFRYWKWRLGISSRRKHNPIHHRHNRKFLSWRSCRCFTLSRSLRCFTYFPLKVEFLTGHKASCSTKQTGQLWLRCLRILFENSKRPTWIIPRNTSGVCLFSRWA